MNDAATRLIRFNKPFDVLCQFTDQQGRQTLADYIDVPGVYAAGRLDRDSEGLLLLTDNGQLQARISSPRFKLPKTYLAQVDGSITAAALQSLMQGVQLKDGPARALSACKVDEPDWLWPRQPPIRVRKAIPTSWVELVLTEGRNRQVRRMTAATGFPTLRLIRTAIGPCTVSGLDNGQWQDLEAVAASTLFSSTAESRRNQPRNQPRQHPKKPVK